jgi:predicted transcriptional regulator
MGAFSVKRDCPLITRKYAQMWLSQEFLYRVETELEQANKNARLLAKDLIVPVQELKKNIAKSRGSRPLTWKERLIYDADNPSVIAVARLVKEGKTRSEIAEELGLRQSTVAKYASLARGTGSLAKLGLYLKP